MNTPEKCPKCGAGFLQVETDDWEGHILTYARFKCETTVYEDSQLRLQGHFCIISERDQLAARVRQLESSLRECTEWIRATADSGDAGNFDATDVECYRKAVNLLKT